MKLLSSILLSTLSTAAFAQSITQVGFTFNPDLLTVDAGQTITITLGGNHTCTEVSEETWNMNQNISNGGFNFSAGTHELTLNTPGTYYYVCMPHASSGMKGRIIVTGPNGIGETNGGSSLGLFPNPANSELRLTSIPAEARMITLVDAQGREAFHMPLNGSGPIDISALSEGNYTALITNTARTILARERFTIVR